MELRLVSSLQVLGYFIQYQYVAIGMTPRINSLSQRFGSLSTTPCFKDLHKKNVSCQKMNLQNVPDDLPNDVVILDLSYNNLPSLHNNSFSRYTLVMNLNLCLNKIYFIEIATFYPLVHLRELDLSFNRYKNNIQSEIFRWSYNLLSLSFCGSNVTYFPADILKWMPRLQSLDIGFNPLRSVNFTACPKKSLNVLYIWDGDFPSLHIKMFTKETFIFPCKCFELWLTLNALQVVDPEVIASLPIKYLYLEMPESKLAYTMQACKDLVKGIGQSSIEIFHLRYVDCKMFNALKILRNKYLSSLTVNFGDLKKCLNKTSLTLPRVDKLFMSQENMNLIRPEYFNDMKELKELHLVNNKIVRIDTSSSIWNISLHYLYLSSNLLSYLDVHAFEGLDNLSCLGLSDNRHLFGLKLSLPNLKYLDISRTAIEQGMLSGMSNLMSFSFCERFLPEIISGTFLHWDSFLNTSSLTKIELSNSRVGLNELWFQNREISLFHDLNNLQFIDLHGNNILRLPFGIFHHLRSLYKLDLSYCKISHIDTNVFIDLKLLSILHLENNEISSLPPGLFNTTRELLVLHIDSNFLSYLDKDLFVNIPNLIELTISRNKLLKLQCDTFSPIQSSLKSIDISLNPLQCSCDIKWLVQWLRNSIDSFEVDAASCLDNNLQKKLLNTIDLDELCPSHSTSYWFISSLIGMLLVLITVTLIRERKWALKYKMYLLKLAVCGYNECQDARDHEDYLFDLNIMFIRDDEEWVMQHFRPNLQEHVPQFRRIAYGDNELPAGMHYLDAIHYLIEHSFKTILLLSRASIQDDDFMIKLRTALNHMTDTNMQRTMLVFLDEIPDEGMPYLVKLYLSEQGCYISWPHDERDQQYFWLYLAKNLLVNLKRNDMIPVE